MSKKLVLSDNDISIFHAERMQLLFKQYMATPIKANYDGWDPEVNADFQATNINQGQDFYSAPQLKTIVFGINISL